MYFMYNTPSMADWFYFVRVHFTEQSTRTDFILPYLTLLGMFDWVWQSMEMWFFLNVLNLRMGLKCLKDASTVFHILKYAPVK
jgi:hypothetical protein